MSETHEAVGSTPTDRAISGLLTDEEYEQLMQLLRTNHPDHTLMEFKPRGA